MGHFSKRVYEHVAKLFDLEVVALHQQPRDVEFEHVTPRTASNLPYKLFRKLASKTFSALYQLTGEPGANILAILRKPARAE
jgi:hypothetical protein